MEATRMRTAQFFALVLTALALLPVGAHLFALPNKIGKTEAHAVNAAITFAAYCCMTLSVILSRRWKH
jgi:hypothetical protein